MLANRKKQNHNTVSNNINIAPHSLEAEQSVLGSIMLDNQCWDAIETILITDDFYTHAHRLIFQEMQNLYREQHPLDLITLDQQLKNKGLTDDVGGFAYLAEISQNTPSVANIVSYANIVRDKSILRSLISTTNQIAKDAYQPAGKDTSTILDDAERNILAIAEKRMISDQGPQKGIDILENTLEKIRLLSKVNNGITGISTGFADLDKKTAGLQNSDLIIVAARPSMGKTTFAMNLCESAAFSADKPVLIFSLEMPSEQLMMRLLASLCKIQQTKIRTGQIHNDDEWARISSAMGLMNNKPNIFIDDSSSLTPTELRARARRVHRETGGLGMIMVDYLQLMRVPGFQERHLEIGEISRSLKALAKELNIPVVALSQLNRSLEQRADKRPINSDLRESGSIEQDADLIMFLYRDWVYNKESEANIAEVIIGKQRNGPIGSVKLVFQGEYARFDNHTDAYSMDE